MRVAVLSLCIALGPVPALAAEYLAPVGNCDGATMMLEAARQAHLRSGAALAAAGGGCSAARTAALDANLASAHLLDRRARRAMAACPGMDDEMWQGEQMTRLARNDITESDKARAVCKAP
jgi:hypothetical protein